MFVSLELCNEPRNSFGTLVILGVLTFGISILIWYICLKHQSSETDKGTYILYVCEVAFDKYIYVLICAYVCIRISNVIFYECTCVSYVFLDLLFSKN